MTATTIRVQMAQRKDTAANWTAANPILLSGEIGYETDTKKFKIGDGSTAWNSLAYLPIPDGSGNLTITGNLEIGSTGSLTFEGSTADGFETTLAVTNPTADRTITLPNQSGTMLVSGNASIVDADIAANAEIAVSKLADGAARQLLQTDAASTGVEWTSNIDVPGTLDVTNTATFDSIAQYPAGSAAAPTITFTGDTNTGLFSPGSDQLALATGGTGRLFVDAAGDVGLGVVPTGGERLTVNGNIGVGGNLIARGPVEVMNSNYVYLYNTGSSTYWDLRNNSNNLTFRYNGSEAMRLDSSGRLGLGTSTATERLTVAGNISLSAAQPYISLVDSGWGAGTTIRSGVNTLGTATGDYQLFNVPTGKGFAFAQNNTANSLVIDASNRVGIGTTAPSSLFHVSGSGTVIQQIQSTGGATELKLIANTQTNASYNNIYSGDGTNWNWAIGGSDGTTNTLTLKTGGTERARIDSSGRLLVGTSTARSNVQFGGGNTTPTVQVETAGDSRFGLSVINNSANGYAGAIRIGAARGTSVGSNTALVDTAGLGSLSFVGADGTNLIEGARIDAVVNGTPGTNDLPTALVFSTTADGASSPTERMRIGASGNVGIGQSDEAGIRLAVTSTGTAYAGYFSYPGSTAQGVGFNSTGAGSSYAAYFFNNGTNVGSIYTTSSSTSYNTSSDYRLKENVVPLTGAIDRLNDLQVHRFNFIADPAGTVDGFIAHEAQAVVPECVTGEKDAVDDNGNPVYQGIDQSKLVPLLTAALQEALAEIETLKARVTALEP